MYALSTCAALLFAYFFITGAVTNAIIALVITVTLFALSIISSIFSRDAKQGVEELKKIGTSLDRNENQNVILKNLENEPYNRDQNTIINQEIE